MRLLYLEQRLLFQEHLFPASLCITCRLICKCTACQECQECHRCTACQECQECPRCLCMACLRCTACLQCLECLMVRAFRWCFVDSSGYFPYAPPPFQPPFMPHEGFPMASGMASFPHQDGNLAVCVFQTLIRTDLPTSTIWLGNLPPNTTENDVAKLFSSHPTFYEIKVMTDFDCFDLTI
jgi:hypothetical protein